MKVFKLARISYLSKVILVTSGLIIGIFTGVIYGENIKHAIIRSDKNNELPTNLDYSEVEQVYDALRTNFDGELNTVDLISGLKDGLARASGDEYTEFLDEKETEEFEEELSGSFTGIGAELGREEDTIVVIAPLEGFPAQKAGLRSKDVIAEIDGQSAYGLSISDAVSKIRGPKDTKVVLTIIRDNSEQLTIEITRDQITIPSVKSEIIEGNIGYMKVTRFGEDTFDLSQQAAEKFKNANVKGVILDLRNNPGGLLDAAVDLSGIWVKSGKHVLEERSGDKTIKIFKSDGDGTLSSVKTVVLINEGSASASEIVAGALKDHNLAMLVGEKSYGKGSVQQLIDFANGTKLKVTIARWYTPNGKNIDKEGIEPDQKVELTDDDYKNSRDPQKTKALELL